MITTLKIENFRRFRELSFPALKRVNLIGGKNNTGKTGVLEALVLLLGRDRIGELPNLFRNAQTRGDVRETFWKWQFHNRNVDAAISVAAEMGTDRQLSISASLPAGSTLKDVFPVYSGSLVVAGRAKGDVEKIFSDHSIASLPARATNPEEDALQYDRIALKPGAEERLEKLLRNIEAPLRNIRSIKPHGVPLLYVDLGLPERIPAIHLGQGFMRLLSIYSEILAGNKRILLIDEVETGLHHSVLLEIWRGLLNLSESENVQIFATTHSYECVVAAHKAFSETFAYDFAFHRLEEVKSEVRAITYDKETLQTAIDSNWEVR